MMINKLSSAAKKGAAKKGGATLFPKHRLALKHELELRGYTLADVAERSGRTRAAVSMVVHGNLDSAAILQTIYELLSAEAA